MESYDMLLWLCFEFFIIVAIGWDEARLGLHR